MMDADPDFYKRPWTPADDQALDQMRMPLTGEHVKLLMKARVCSEGVDHTEPPHKWLGTLVQEYALGPVDKAGVPLRFKRTIN